MLTQNGCRERQQRLRRALVDHNLDAAVITDPHEIYYFAGVLLMEMPFQLPGLLWIDANSVWLIAPTGTDGALADETLTYAQSLGSTTNTDCLRRLNALVAAKLGGSAQRIGYQAETLSHLVASTIEDRLHPDEWIALDDVIDKMQWRKDPDELDLIRRSIQCDLAAYAAVQRTIQPGVRELDVLAAGQQAAIWTAGEYVYHNGDYKAGARGGWARDRQIEEGEMYVVDAWTRFQGYWSDLSRAFIVGDTVTPLQQSVFDHIKSVQEAVPGILKPGIDGTEVWRQLDALVREHPALKDVGLPHHAGHSLGLRAHDLPDLNRERGGVLEVGTVVSVEPGGYIEDEGVFVRLENMYLITPDGAENLSVFPIALK